MRTINEIFGIHIRPLRQAITLLSQQWQQFDELVRATGAPRKTIEELIGALGEDLEHDGKSLRLRPTAVARYAAHQTSTPTDPLDAAITANPELLAAVRQQIAQVPPPIASLDHVQATPKTVRRRALWLAENYDLDRAKLVFLGDHDLTSLAVRAIHPQARMTVVDLDERILEYVDRLSARSITTLHADLRFGLPHGITGSADLVFSDPPYTPEGMGLFALRGLQTLSDPPNGRLLLAYGYSQRHPALGAQAQRELAILGITFEAILPGFNEYFGAQAIGSRADLYVCQPTAQAKKTRKRKEKSGIYTHGSQSVESGSAGARSSDKKTALIAKTRDIAEETGLSAEIRPVDLSTPKGTDAALVMDLTDDPGQWLLRVLLAAKAQRLAILLPNSHHNLTNAQGQKELTDLIGAKYRVKFLRSIPDNNHAVVVADLLDDAPDLLTKAHARLANILPKAMIENPEHADILDHRLIDLPRHRIQELLRSP
jgi:hypothetical protein